MALERIDKIIASRTAYSRREVKELIKKGAVRLDGSLVLSPDQKLDPVLQSIEIDGKRLFYEKYSYLMLNKPQGYVSATRDGKEKTVLALLSPEWQSRKLFPAGRLDKDTTGFVLLTDDGAFAHDVLAPKHHVPKVYHLTAQRAVSAAERRQMEEGMMLDGQKLLGAKLRLLDQESCRYEIILQQGLYHQIKRMFAATGNQVLTLHRVAIGGVFLDPDLAEGQYRHLTVQEVNTIKNSRENL